LVLEREEHARARGAAPLAELAGYGATNEAHHPTAPSPDGEGGRRAISLALADAGVDRREVTHINAHGTATQVNDLAEAVAIRGAFGAHADAIAVTSTKSATGHLLGAAGAVEAIATVAALRDGLVAPTQNLVIRDPAIDLDVVTEAPRRVDPSVACSHSFGFGGHNAVLVLRRF